MAAAVIGISPGTKAIGIVFLRNGQLDYWSIHTGNAAVVAAASSVIRKYNITHIAMLGSHVEANFPRQERLTRDIRALAKSKGIPVSVYSTYELRRKLPGGHMNKQTLFRRLTEEIPELSAYYPKYERERNAYWSKLFEAVACAHLIAMQ